MTNKEKFIALVQEFMRILNMREDSIYVLEGAFDVNEIDLDTLDADGLRRYALHFVEDTPRLSSQREMAEVAKSWIGEMKYNY